MEKTKLGVSVGIFGAFLYVAALFGGYIAITLLAGYVLLMESNEWLKKTASESSCNTGMFQLPFSFSWSDSGCCGCDYRSFQCIL